MGGIVFCLSATAANTVQPVVVSGLETMYYGTQICGTIVLVFTLIVAVAQYFFHKGEYKENHRFNVELHEHRKREKALELTGFYKDNILGHTIMFNRVYQKIGIKQMLGKVKQSDMKNFDEYELERNYIKADLDEIRKIKKTDKFFEALEEFHHIHKTNRNEIGKDKLDLNDPEVRDRLETSYLDEQRKILNHLEFFAMHFVNGVANEEIVYQSLHKTFLTIVELFYFDICLNNVKDGSKLFTNVIALYNKWKDRAEKEKAEREAVYRGQRNNP